MLLLTFAAVAASLVLLDLGITLLMRSGWTRFCILLSSDLISLWRRQSPRGSRTRGAPAAKNSDHPKAWVAAPHRQTPGRVGTLAAENITANPLDQRAGRRVDALERIFRGRIGLKSKQGFRRMVNILQTAFHAENRHGVRNTVDRRLHAQWARSKSPNELLRYSAKFAAIALKSRPRPANSSLPRTCARASKLPSPILPRLR